MNNNIKKFFNDIDKSIFDNPTELAKHFLYHSIHCKPNEIDTKDSNIAILSDDNSLNYITKRALLISSNLLLSNKSATPTNIHIDRSASASGYIYKYYTFNNDLNALGIWLQQARSLIINGNITYIPHSYGYCYDCDGAGNYLYGGYTETLTTLDDLPKHIIKSKKLITTTHNLHSLFLEPVLNIQIPIIDDVDLETFSNITLDNLDAACNFQTYLQSTILEMNDLSAKNCAKVSTELQLQLNDIQRLYNKTINKYMVNSAVGCVTTITAVLLCCTPNISEAIKIAAGVSSTCGLIPFLQSNIERFTLNDSLKDNNCYYLWVLQK